MKSITENYDTHTKEELLDEVQLRGLEGISPSSLKSDIVATLESDDRERLKSSRVRQTDEDPDVVKGKRSRGLRSVDTALNRLTSAGSKLATAVDKGFETYRDERKKSAQKKKDGALLDLMNNVAEGVKVAQENSGGATKDLLTMFWTKRNKKQFRKLARSVSSLVPFIR